MLVGAQTAVNDVVVFGGGGHARAVVDVVIRAGGSVASVVDPTGGDWAGSHTEVSDDEALTLAVTHGHPVFAAVGDGSRRLSLVRWALERGATVATIVAASSTASRDARVQPGTVLMEHSHVGPGSALGLACIVNTGAVVEHDNELGDGVHIGPGAVLTGGCRCRDGTWVGAGAVVLPGITLGRGVRVGAGAVVTKNIADGLTVAGMPAWER